MRVMLIEGRGGAPIALFRRSGGIYEPTAAQVFERARLSHPHHVLTLRSALVDRVA